MSNVPLMPMATAVWLVENKTLTFKKIANFCTKVFVKSLENKYAGMAPSDFHFMHSDGRGCVNQQLATHSQLLSQRLS